MKNITKASSFIKHRYQFISRISISDLNVDFQSQKSFHT